MSTLSIELVGQGYAKIMIQKSIYFFQKQPLEYNCKGCSEKVLQSVVGIQSSQHTYCVMSFIKNTAKMEQCLVLNEKGACNSVKSIVNKCSLPDRVCSLNSIMHFSYTFQDQLMISQPEVILIIIYRKRI